MNTIKKLATVFGLAGVLLANAPLRGQDQPLVVEGGTLIDGNGGPAIPNSVVVIEGNHFKEVGVKGKVAIPKNAKIINATGKFVLPGLVDALAQGNWDIQPPMWLYFGVTTVYFNGSDYIRAEQALQQNGQLKGPRMYLTAGGVQGPVELLRDDIKLTAKYWPEGWSVRTPEEAKLAVDKRIAEAKGTARSIFILEGFTPELLRAVTDEAHHNGLTVGGRSEFVSMTAANGQDYSWHMASVIRSTITDPENVAKLKEMRKNNWELYWPITDGNYAYMMEPDKFDTLIKQLVTYHFFIAPTISHAIWGWGVQIPHAREWNQELIDFAKNTQGIQYVPESIRHLWLTADKPTDRVKGRYVVGDQVDATHPHDMEGYAKRDEFLRKFVKAGGKLEGGADNSFDVVTGLTTHQELQQLVYSGLTPMEAILSVTKWAAEAWHVDNEVGSVSPGKLADLITVNGDPLENIKNTRNVDMVILDGKVIDKSFDPNWKNPIPKPQNEYRGRTYNDFDKK